MEEEGGIILINSGVSPWTSRGGSSGTNRKAYCTTTHSRQPVHTRGSTWASREGSCGHNEAEQVLHIQTRAAKHTVDKQGRPARTKREA